MQLLLVLAVRVKAFAKIADAVPEFAFFEGGEGKGLETSGFDVNGSIFKARAACERPSNMHHR